MVTDLHHMLRHGKVPAAPWICFYGPWDHLNGRQHGMQRLHAEHGRRKTSLRYIDSRHGTLQTTLLILLRRTRSFPPRNLRSLSLSGKMGWHSARLPRNCKCQSQRSEIPSRSLTRRVCRKRQSVPEDLESLTNAISRATKLSILRVRMRSLTWFHRRFWNSIKAKAISISISTFGTTVRKLGFRLSVP